MIYDIEQLTATAGAYIFYNGHFLFMFGCGSNLAQNELGIVRFGGHRNPNETVTQCVKREIKEETMLDCHLFNNKITYNFYNRLQHYQKIERDIEPSKLSASSLPIFISDKGNNLSVMYLAHGKGELKPNMETQGILLLKPRDINFLCSKKRTFADYIDKGGQFILTEKLQKIKQKPEDFALAPKPQLLFLNQLFKLEPELMERFCNNK